MLFNESIKLKCFNFAVVILDCTPELEEGRLFLKR